MNKDCQGCEGPNCLHQKWQYRDTAPTKTLTRIRKRSRTPNEPKMHDNDKTSFTFQPACLCPNSCATHGARQMRTDKDTPQLVKAISSCVSGRAMASPGRHQPRRCKRTPCGSSWWWEDVLLQIMFPELRPAGASGGPLPFDWCPTQANRHGNGGPLACSQSAASRGSVEKLFSGKPLVLV